MEGERFTTMYHSGSICAVRSELYSVTDQKRKKEKDNHSYEILDYAYQGLKTFSSH